MIADAYRFSINEYLEERKTRGTVLFPCSCYKGDVHQFVGGRLSLHWHNEFELFILDSGTVLIQTEGQEFLLSPGEGYFSNSGALHGIMPKGKDACCFHSIVFNSSIISGMPDSAYEQFYVRPFIGSGIQIYPLLKSDSVSHQIIELFETAYTACSTETQYYEFSVRNALSEILLLLKSIEELTSAPALSDQSQRIKTMILWMDLHYAENITIDMIAKSSNISVRECQRSFKAIVQLSPMQYLENIRICAAVQLLRTTSKSISEIAFECGYTNSSYFSNLFKKKTGETPLQFKKHIQNAI